MGHFMDVYNKIREEELNKRKLAEGEDTRYIKPKTEPKVSDELVDEVIEETEIYRKAKEHILKAQRKQVAYGIEKYPEPLNANTWSIIETIDHAIDESVDKLHYLVMLRIKLEASTKPDDGLDAMMHALKFSNDHGRVYADDILVREGRLNSKGEYK